MPSDDTAARRVTLPGGFNVLTTLLAALVNGLLATIKKEEALMVPRDRRLVHISVFALLLLAIATLILVFPAASRADASNPPWQQRCPQRIVLVLDLSASMEPSLDAVKQSADDLVDALRGTPNKIAVVTFGTDAVIAVPPSNVGDDTTRRQVKDQVDALSIFPGDGGATNWEAAFIAAHSLQPDLVVFLTDGLPNAHGQPATQEYDVSSTEYLTSAVRAADTLRSDGTRIVGLGLGLLPENVGNLVDVTGPRAGEDFYQTDTSELLNRLYEIAGKACGVPVAALPQPEPGTFPLMPVLGTALVAVLAAAVGGLLLSRRRSRPLTTSRTSTGPLPDPSIRVDDIPPAASSLTVPEEPSPPAARPVADPETHRRDPRRISLSRIQNASPPRRDHPDGTTGSGT